MVELLFTKRVNFCSLNGFSLLSLKFRLKETTVSGTSSVIEYERHSQNICLRHILCIPDTT